MTRHLVLGLSLILATATACSTAKPKAEEIQQAAAAPATVPTAVAADENLSGDSDSGKAGALKSIQFTYDSFVLDADGKEVLKANAEYLKAHSSVKVQIEGHCDIRGGIQYNIALGEKRANAAKSFLLDQSIAADRVSTISFGKEKLLDNGTSDEAHKKNRRGNFVITTK